MKLTRIIALAIIAGTISSHGASAQQFRSASPPSEVPPNSYQGRQFVDSRGCVYIRAGIDGQVNWVPRVERNRRQLCGFQPTNVAGTTAPARQAATSASGPELITLPAADQPGATAAATPPAAARPAPVVQPPKVVAQQKPRRAAPVPARAAPAPQPKPQTVRRVQRAVPAPVVVAPQPTSPTTAAGTCAGLSEISRQYTNSTGVRCGPQDQSPVTFGPQSSLQLPPDTRVLPAHLYSDRQLAKGVETPPGYRTVWQDGRLNPKRGEQDLIPRSVTSHVVPEGFVRVPSSAPRLNPNRGQRTLAGDQRTAQIWTETLPRKLVPVPTPPTVTVEKRAQQTNAQLGFLSADQSAQLAASPRYVRAGVFSDAADADIAAQRLTAQGLPVRLGRMTRQGQNYKVVLAGPFHGDSAAHAALSTVQNAGFTRARLSK
ncbi:SPOR domain-containing protein [Epibacterium ulvae]|uniref:SPOR domain-containing protein n=1 Tax=Epibacterium ulvae TaxID=1156985 RepID=UPI001BFC41C6|nr:SPOR domain-containing protein [Epibacterium ulvae]MBT8152895.1 SPOR domain-containing protein [Epibacterium ulvae]